MISESELKALTEYIVELEAQVDFLSRERILSTEGREAMERATNPTEDLLQPLPAGLGRGAAGQVVCLTHEAALTHSQHRDWFKPTRRKGAAKSPGGG